MTLVETGDDRHGMSGHKCRGVFAQLIISREGLVGAFVSKLIHGSQSLDRCLTPFQGTRYWKASNSVVDPITVMAAEINNVIIVFLLNSMPQCQVS